MSSLRISTFVLMLLTASLGLAQDSKSDYLMRLEHGTLSSNTCVLLQRTGAYHLEISDRENTKVFEGSLKDAELQQVASELKQLIGLLSEKQIEEPLIGHHEVLKLDIPRAERWSEVRFLTAESQEPYQQWLQPLIRWLNDLHKLPHKELTEDAGKNNCLPPGKIALKKRGDGASPLSSDPGSARAASLPHNASSTGPAPKPDALLRMDAFGIKSNTYFQNCVLVADDGSYRAEERSQKNGSKKVELKLNGGKLAPAEISQLRELLSDPGLAGIRHRETSRLQLAISGEMVELKIPRPSGLQEIVLSSTFNRPGVPFFYSGDGDIARARPLLDFLAEHVENVGLGSLDPGLRNGCTDAP